MPLEERVEALLAELTADEKCGFINYRNEGVPRLGIPPYVWWNEALHGLARSGSATVFPQAIAMAATFSPELVRKMGEVIATEGRARHFDARRHGDFGTYKGLTYWSPNVNIYRDPRWGRGQETYGECPFLTGEMGAAYVRGRPGAGSGTPPRRRHAETFCRPLRTGGDPARLQLPGFGKGSAGDLSSRLPQVHRRRRPLDHERLQRAQRHAVQRQRPAAPEDPARGVEIHRARWSPTPEPGMRWSATTGVRPTTRRRWRRSFTPESTWITDWPFGAREALERGLIREEEIDRAVRNQLRVLFSLGLFDDPPRDVPSPEVIECEAHRHLALEASRRSIVLLKNRNGLLPLDLEKGGTIAVIGPNADSREVLLGNYCGTPTRSVTLLEGILAAAEPCWKVVYARGCEPVAPKTEGCAEEGDRIAEAVSAAERADVVLLCVGLNPQIEGESGDAFNSDAAGDKPTLELPGLQQRLIDSVAAVGKPVILAVVSGGALVLPRRRPTRCSSVFTPGRRGEPLSRKWCSGASTPRGGCR